MEHRGIVHTMFCENNGPLVSKINGDNGRFNGDWRVFAHEFGHQLDLTHEGFWSVPYCALYPSLMSYTYSYSLGDDGDKIQYSDGSLASFPINELHLSKRLPFPIEKVKFLSGGPYHFRIKPSDDGKSTFVDWNWNGIFDEEDVSASINYSHGADMGPGHNVAKAQTAPVLVNTGSKILLFYGQATPRGQRLIARSWLGTNRDTEADHWSDEAVLDESGVAGDPTATCLNGIVWVAYASPQGVELRKVSVDSSGKPIAGEAMAIPKTKGAQPTLAAVGGRLVLLLWRTRDVPVAVRMLDAGGVPTPEVTLDIDSAAPVAAAAGATVTEGASLWVVHILAADPHRGKTEAVRYILGADRRLQSVEKRLIGGDYNPHRSALLWQDEPGLQPTGRLYHFSGCATPPDQPLSAQYFAMNVPYPDIDGGWLVRRYFQPDFTSASAPGVCFYDKNIVYAVRRGDDTVCVYFYGNGATAARMGDFDDIGHIRDYGISHSLHEVPK
jgi:hypothetical protein